MSRGHHIMMQARRNPSRAATKSPASVGVQRQPARPSLPAAEMYLLGYERSAEARPVDCGFSRCVAYKSGNASYSLCAQIKDERSVRWCSRLKWNHLASFTNDPSTECGQPRHACCDEVARRLLESRKGIRQAECGRVYAQRSRVSHDDKTN